MPQQITFVRGLLVLLAGMLMFSPPALSSHAQTPSPLASPVKGTPTPVYTPPPTFTPQPTFTPLPPTVTVMPPAPPVSVAPIAPAIDPTILIGGGLLALLVLLIAWGLLRRARQRQRALQSTAPVKPITPPPLPPPPPLPATTLEFVDAAGNSLVLAMDKPSLTLGRADDNDLIVPAGVPNADTVSNHHAQFRRDQDDIVVRDLNSRNGLVVNGRHTNHNVLQDGDRIAFGAAEAVFHKPAGGVA